MESRGMIYMFPLGEIGKSSMYRNKKDYRQVIPFDNV